jgi:hypothetical protein
MFKADREVVPLPAGVRGIPDWAIGSKNCRGIVPVARSHYLGLACLNNCMVEVVLDSGGAKTMIDKNTAR